MSTQDVAPITPEELGVMQGWVGRNETLSDEITLAPIRGLSATLDRDDPEPQPGSTLPHLWHWLYFLPRHPQRELGPDGHARRGGFLPPVPLPRRMWAGGDFTWNENNPLRAGDRASRISTIESVAHKKGSGGDLVFVRVRHDVHNAAGLALTERHDIVYRAAARPGDPAPKPAAAEVDAAWQRQVHPDPVLLFRYSALTFNGHRIHYDRSYATGVEAYPGLVVHGPLIATLLLDLLRRNAPSAFIKRFEFKAVRPTFDIHPFSLKGQPGADGRTVRLWAEDHEGWLTMQARAELA
jgi:3-methylfumaryl-CoA hydratase